jgi:hypothetical protein
MRSEDAEMTTDELKALLRECRGALANLTAHEEKDCVPCKITSKIDAALSSDFAVVPRKITEEMSSALNAMAQCEGFIEEGYNDMIKVAEKK